MNRKILLMLLAPLNCIFAQNAVDYSIFTKAAGEQSVLYRGSAPIPYKTIHTGTYYAFSPLFVRGAVVYNNKYYSNQLLNLNAELDELYIQTPNPAVVIVLNKRFVDSFSLEDHLFVNISENKAGLSAGYYEILFDDETKLYKKITKSYVEKADNTQILRREFETINTYYVYYQGKWSVVKNKRQLLKLSGDHKKEIRKKIKEENLDFDRAKEGAFLEIVKFMGNITVEKSQ